MIKINRLDHFVLTVRDIKATCAFYQTVLGMQAKLTWRPGTNQR